jgi:hypothetical protein
MVVQFVYTGRNHLSHDLNLIFRVNLSLRTNHYSSFDFRFVFGIAARGFGFMPIIARTVASRRRAVSSAL